jgi:hypothetical protein
MDVSLVVGCLYGLIAKHNANDPTNAIQRTGSPSQLLQQMQWMQLMQANAWGLGSAPDSSMQSREN